MVQIDEQRAISRVMDLIAIPGGSGGERDVSAWICQQLVKAGVPESSISIDRAHRKSPAGGNTGNLIVRLRGTKKGPHRLLMAHMDTVPLAVGAKPIREGDWIRPASGATALGGDNRAGCAVVLTALLEVLSKGRDYPPLTLLFTVQEETGLRGARWLSASKLGRPALCFNWDGRDPASLITGAVGASNLSIEIEGIASHAGAHPEDGVNAAVVSSLAIAQLQKSGWHGQIRRGKQRGTSNLGVIRGGDATNVVMSRVQIEAEAQSRRGVSGADRCCVAGGVRVGCGCSQQCWWSAGNSEIHGRTAIRGLPDGSGQCLCSGCRCCSASGGYEACGSDLRRRSGCQLDGGAWIPCGYAGLWPARHSHSA